MKFGLSSIAGAILFVALFAAVGIRAAGSEPTVKIDTGKLEGKSDGTITAFLGVPFAKPPVGDLRWKPPVKPVKWKGTRKATEHPLRLNPHSARAHALLGEALLGHDWDRAGAERELGIAMSLGPNDSVVLTHAAQHRLGL